MDIIGFLSSVNKIGLLAFIITFGFLVYEIYQLRKNKKKPEQPTIPVFKESQMILPPQPTISPSGSKVPKTANNRVLIIIVIVFILFGLIIITFGFLNINKQSVKKPSNVAVKPTLAIINSKGILLFSQDFQPLSDAESKQIKPGDSLYLGVESVQRTDIDQARIRVNSSEWSDNNITTQFDKSHNVFYIKYEVATSDAMLNIEAQLHSKTNGWFGKE